MKSTSEHPSSSEDDKTMRMEMIRSALPDCQPQEGSPANTFTTAEKEQLLTAFPNMNIANKPHPQPAETQDLIDICDWSQQHKPLQEEEETKPEEKEEPSLLKPILATPLSQANGQEEPQEEDPLSWHGAPRIQERLPTQAFRADVRAGRFTSPTNGVCPGYLQCNLVVLPQGPIAFDFLLFCQRNKKACPLIEVCDVGSPFPHGVARGADLRTDIPKYAIYRDGQLEKEVTDVTDDWPENSVAFLIGCSFSYDGALLEAHIPLKSADQGKNVPMYKTNLQCRPAGRLRGNTVVSMKPIKALDVAKEVEITNKFPHAHGGPICVGNPQAIGIANLDAPDWGDAIDVAIDETPVFHACGVTPQSVLMDSKVPFAITHSAGYMFVTDLPADTAF